MVTKMCELGLLALRTFCEKSKSSRPFVSTAKSRKVHEKATMIKRVTRQKVLGLAVLLAGVSFLKVVGCVF